MSVPTNGAYILTANIIVNAIWFPFHDIILAITCNTHAIPKLPIIYFTNFLPSQAVASAPITLFKPSSFCNALSFTTSTIEFSLFIITSTSFMCPSIIHISFPAIAHLTLSQPYAPLYSITIKCTPNHKIQTNQIISTIPALPFFGCLLNRLIRLNTKSLVTTTGTC